MFQRILYLIIFSYLGIQLSVGQHTVDFQVPSQVCLGEFLNIQNTSDTGDASWNFCSSLDKTYTNQSYGSISSNVSGLSIIQNSGEWIGFAVTRNNELIRINFGSQISSTYQKTSLGNPGNLLNGPDGIQLIKSNGKWYGLVSNQANNDIIRLVWSDLSLAPTAQSLGLSGSGKLSSPAQIEIELDGSNYVAVVANATSNQLALINFGQSMETTPNGGTDIILSPVFSGGVNMYGVTSIRSCDQWVIYTSVTDKMYKVNIGQQLFSTINQSQIIDLTSDIPISVGSYTRLKSVIEGGDTYVYFTSYTRSGLAAFVWRSGATALEFKDLTTLPLPSNLYSLEVYNSGSSLGIFVDSFTTSATNYITVDSSCAASQQISAEATPQGIYFNAPGSYSISLSMKFADGIVCSTKKTITVTNSTAPDIAFSSLNICANHDVSFISQNSSGNITAYEWSFGDATTANIQNPIHQYVSGGTYDVSLKLNASNACANTVKKSIKIYDSPSAGFSIPTGLICTNNEFTFTNNTTDNFDGNLSYQWLVDNVAQSTSRDLKYAFTSGGNNEIKLITSIPGCSDENAQIVNNVFFGPTVGFSQTGQCEADQVQFTNSSSGTITGYLWDFGNNNTSTQLNPTQVYSAKGTYNVSLKTTASNGCESTIVKPLTIYSKPVPNFSLDLPPFSCSGTPSQFNDLTSNPTDSNLASWAWNFSDAGTSTERNPLHTFTNAGDYNVSLTAITNFGCSGSFQKSVTIAASPPADFSFTPACINQGTRFTDASGNGVKSWLWTIGSSTYAFSNPTHVFSTSGNYTAKLTVTGNNNCVATVGKTINVPVAPSLNFSVDNACETQAANFKDTSPTNTDPTASWAWDFAGQGIATGIASQYSFAKAGSYVVKMTSTQQSGCVYSLSKNVIINTTPVAKFTSSPEWGVPPLSVQFTNASSGASSYSWHFNDKNNSTSTQASPSFQFTDLGDYVVDLLATSALGCSSSASGKISVIIPSLDLELKQLQLVKDPTSNVYRIFVTVKNKSNYLLTSVDVVVDISGSALIKETINTSLAPDAEIVQLLNNQILPRNSITYLCASVEVDNDNDPFNNSKCEPIEEETVVFNPYPNPSNGTFSFQWISPTTDNAHFEIFNSVGQLAFEQYAESVQVGLNQVQFDLNNLNTGAYYFRFSSNSTSRTLPIQIVR